MAILDFNVGELVTRLRGLKVRGRIPLTLDDQVLQTVKSDDLTRAPYRYSSRKAFAAVYQPGVAGQYTWFRINNASPQASGQCLILETLKLRKSSVNPVGVVMRYEGLGPAGLTEFVSPEVQDYTIPQPSYAATGFPPRVPYATVDSGTQVPPIVALGNEIIRYEEFPPPNAASAWNLSGIWEDDLDLVIPPQTSFFIGSTNTNMNFTLLCRVRLAE